jgi:hypothetical protein
MTPKYRGKIQIIPQGKYPKFDDTISKIDLLYRRDWKSWGIIKRNAQGFQIGDADWVYSKKEAVAFKKELEKEYKI